MVLGVLIVAAEVHKVQQDGSDDSDDIYIGIKASQKLWNNRFIFYAQSNLVEELKDEKYCQEYVYFKYGYLPKVLFDHEEQHGGNVVDTDSKNKDSLNEELLTL